MVTPYNPNVPGAYDYDNMNPGGRPGGLDKLRGYLDSGQKITPEGFGYYMPEYRPVTDSNGNMLSNFNYAPQSINYGPNGKDPGLASYNAYSKFALGSGPSDYYKATEGLIDKQTSAGLSGVREESARGLAGGMSNLATSGGLDSGSRERLTGSSNLAQINASQGVYQGASMAKGHAAVADQGMRFDALRGLTQLDTNRVNMNTQMGNDAQRWNISNQIGDVRAGNLYDLEGWGKLGDIYGSSQIAAAMGGGPGGGTGQPGLYSMPKNPATGAPAWQAPGGGSRAPTQANNPDAAWYDPRGYDWRVSVGGGGGGGGGGSDGNKNTFW